MGSVKDKLLTVDARWQLKIVGDYLTPKCLGEIKTTQSNQIGPDCSTEFHLVRNAVKNNEDKLKITDPKKKNWAIVHGAVAKDQISTCCHDKFSDSKAAKVCTSGGGKYAQFEGDLTKNNGLDVATSYTKQIERLAASSENYYKDRYKISDRKIRENLITGQMKAIIFRYDVMASRAKEAGQKPLPLIKFVEARVQEQTKEIAKHTKSQTDTTVTETPPEPKAPKVKETPRPLIVKTTKPKTLSPRHLELLNQSKSVFDEHVVQNAKNPTITALQLTTPPILWKLLPTLVKEKMTGIVEEVDDNALTYHTPSQIVTMTIKAISKIPENLMSDAAQHLYGSKINEFDYEYKNVGGSGKLKYNDKWYGKDEIFKLPIILQKVLRDSLAVHRWNDMSIDPNKSNPVKEARNIGVKWLIENDDFTSAALTTENMNLLKAYKALIALPIVRGEL